MGVNFAACAAVIAGGEFNMALDIHIYIDLNFDLENALD